jgi:tetratricopeptide (TPR) repeat protein
MKRPIVAAALLALVGGRALAQQPPSPQFTREYQAGIDAYRLGQYAEARAHLEKAKSFDPALPGPFRFLAAVDQAEGKFADCVTDARTAIKLNPQSSEVESTRKLHDECRASLGRPALTVEPTGGAISVTANIEAASVTLNDLKYGATPLAPRVVAVGAAEIGVSKDGWLAQKKKVDVLPGIVTDVDFTLEPDPNAKVVTDLVDVKPVEPTTGWLIVNGAPGASLLLDGKPVALDKNGRIESDPGVHELEVRATGMEAWRRRVRLARGQKTEVTAELHGAGARESSHKIGTALITVASVLALASAGAAVYSVDQADKAREWLLIERARPASVPLADSAALFPVHTRADIETQNDKAKKWALISDVGYAAAAVSVGVGVYFLLSDRPEERAGAPPPFAIAPLVGPGGTGIVVAKEVRW